MYHYRRPDAVAYIRGENIRLVGIVKLYQEKSGVLVEAEVSGLPENGSGFFGLHIHEGDSCGAVGYSDTGAHFDPVGTTHPQHAGDLPPLLRQSGGKAYLAVHTDRFRVEQAVGRTVVIHSGADDFTTQPAGNAGSKIACGVILAT